MEVNQQCTECTYLASTAGHYRISNLQIVKTICCYYIHTFGLFQLSVLNFIATTYNYYRLFGTIRRPGL